MRAVLLTDTRREETCIFGEEIPRFTLALWIRLEAEEGWLCTDHLQMLAQSVTARRTAGGERDG